jgi:hypothetical protein
MIIPAAIEQNTLLKITARTILMTERMQDFIQMRGETT